ncbi:MAG TPA: hypothetical protein VGP00_01135 [Nocardioides sp.]|nr:hypothetical protein [Nocardioides sp.]
MRKQTPWPVIWSRSLRSHHAIARHNALVAARVLGQRRAEREEVERFLADLHESDTSQGAR